MRRLGDGDFDEYFDVRRQAYAANDDDRAAWLRRNLAHPEIITFGRYGPDLLGALRVIPSGQFLGGRSVPTGLIGGVVVRPEARSRGIARSLLETALTEMRAQGLVASALHPATTRVYRRLGWDLAGRAGWAVVPTRSLAAIAAPDGSHDLVRLADADRPAIRAAWSEYAAGLHGALDRTPGWWQFRETEDAATGTYRYGVRSAGRLTGFLRYRQIPGRRWGYDITVDDFAACDGTSAAMLWRFLGDHSMQVPEVRIPAFVVGDLLLLLDEQDVIVDAVNRWMYRIVDIPGFFAAHGGAFGRRGRVTVAIADPWSDGTTGTWAIEIDDGGANATSAPDVTPELQTDIGAPSSLVIGRFDGSALRRSGRLRGDDAAVDRISALFAAPRPVMTDDF